MIYKIDSINSGGISKIRNIAFIFIFSILFSPDLMAGPIPSGQTTGAQASRFMAESQKRSKALQKQNFNKKNRAGSYIEFKEDKVSPSQPMDEKLKDDAKD